jgi:hypothetical protein
MDERLRRSDRDERVERDTATVKEPTRREQVTRYAEQSQGRPALTRREREERWPIG